MQFTAFFKVADSYATLKASIDAGNYGPPGSQKRKMVAGNANQVPCRCCSAV